MGVSDFGLIPNIDTFLLKSSGYSPVMSTNLGNEKKYGRLITKFFSKCPQKGTPMCHKTTGAVRLGQQLGFGSCIDCCPGVQFCRGMGFGCSRDVRRAVVGEGKQVA